MSLLFIQQESGTIPTIQHLPPITEITSEKLCTSAKEAFIDAYGDEAMETSTDYEAPEKEPNKTQPREDQFELMRPIAACLRVR
ncbi:MAG: hypothetical protein EOP84_08045 [Verrucomicrobiaceae bacterium]|nr:MAG: hypothetical protein EOP84_08045 [Verrucomicrobiaceae bacterium]